jgi:hypothetical protein
LATSAPAGPKLLRMLSLGKVVLNGGKVGRNLNAAGDEFR